jgi:carboxyl-terminal processing protease
MLAAARWTVIGLLAVSVLVLAFAVGYVFRGDGGSDTHASTGNGEEPSGEELDFRTLNEIYDVLDERYVDPDLIDRESLYQAAINGMTGTLPDSGTYYVDPNTLRLSNGPSGTFEGIGATVSSESGQVVIVSPIQDTPAERAGLRSGDVILEVDGESTNGWTSEKAALKIRGPRGSTVTLKVRHEDGEE